MFYKLIHSEKAIRNFVELLPQLEKDNVWMLILCARNKYLGELRKEYHLGDSSVLHREIIRKTDPDLFIKHIKRFECSVGGYVDLNNKPLPNECLALYLTINPRSTIKAMSGLFKRFGEYSVELANCHDKKEIYEKFKRLDRNVMTDIQSSRGEKYFIDIDFDMPKAQAYECIMKMVSDLNIKDFFSIETRGGFHLVINKNSPFNNEKMFEYIKMFHGLVKDSGGEVMFNKQDMIPMVGCTQGGFKTTTSF